MIIRPYFLVLLLVLATSCAARHGALTAGRGNTEISASVGGPVFHNIGAPIPLPLVHVGADYGVTDQVDVAGGVHAMAAIYGTIGVDLGVRYQLWKRQDGAALAATALVDLFAGTRDGLELRAFPELGVHGQWPLARGFLALAGIDTLAQLDPPPGKPPILAAPYLGLERQVGRASALSFTLGWISPWQDSTSVIDYAPATRGALALQFGYRRSFGGEGR